MNATPSRSDQFDPVTLEILWSRLISIADESAAALLRTSFSTIVRESNDFGTVLMDANGDSLSENTGGIPSFSGILPRTLKHFLAKFPRETWKPGDCVITNDPWLATGHLPDITVAMPIFFEGKLVGFSGSIAHSPDIGGSLWSADCRELFEEGIRIPPMKFLREGKPNQDLLDMILGNVRLPDQVLGDLNAQVTANQVCGKRLAEFLEDARLANVEGLSRALQTRAESAMRNAIETVPDGRYHATLDADGFDEDETHIECTITVAGSDLTVDYAGTSKQISRGLNTVMNYTYAYSAYPIKCALDPRTPRNEGSYRPIQVTAPEGCILNPRYPAPCNARQLTGHLLA
ncbi:MAG: hydantoinase B/oxoprolinase family protein, partial [Alphaproteobacteria bacterium]